jgi:hypothetical protein
MGIERSERNILFRCDVNTTVNTFNLVEAIVDTPSPVEVDVNFSLRLIVLDIDQEHS